jgi:predicted TIM-barrel fold metal-dependent hydrolase
MAAGENERFAADARQWPRRYPLAIAGPHDSEEQLRECVLSGGFYGFKVAVNLERSAYHTDRITYVFSKAQRDLANELGLIVMLHIPRERRLADPDNVSDLQLVCRENPNAKIVLAHLGRSYCSWVIRDSIRALKDLDNLYWDASFVQDPMVFQILFENVDSRRVFYGTDQPLADIRGRRVNVNNTWVDVTRDRYSWTAFRREGLEIEATFIAYEIARAMIEGARMAGLTPEQLRATFFDNGMALIRGVRSSLHIE